MSVWLRLSIIPVAILVSSGTVLLHLPAKIRYELSYNSLNEWIELNTPQSNSAVVAINSWIGLYYVESAEYSDGCVYLIMARDGWGYGRGLAMCREEHLDASASYLYLGNDWYQWRAFH